MRERLDAFLSRSGIASRSGAKALVRRGRVTVDGAVCRDPAQIVDGNDVAFDGERVERPKDVLHVVVHKPVGYSCSHDPAESPTLYELLPPAFVTAGLEAAGRLDRETSGLLVLSTEGQFIQRLTHPRRHVPRRYRVGYSGELKPDSVARFARGIRIDDDEEPTKPATLEIHERTPDGRGRATVILDEGRYHQVRRMFTACGAEVVELHRDRIGAFDLPGDLTAGRCRELTPAEIERLFTDPRGAPPE